MPLKIAAQMDPIASLHIGGDSTFALLLEAQARGHEIHYYTPNQLAMRDGTVEADIHKITVADVEGSHFEQEPARTTRLDSLDVILLRQDPPFDMNYITTTHLLERVHPEVLVVNNPAEVRNAPEKILVTEFPDLMPPTLVTRAHEHIRAFHKEFRDIIVKPLYGNGGTGVFRLKEGDTNLASLLELFEQIYPEPFMIQQYIPDVRAGDKRIILVDGEIAGAINRIPAKNETRSNMHVGGRPEHTDITDRDREICERLRPVLKDRGLLFAGIDVIGRYITEINVTSPTGLREIERFASVNIAAQIWDKIEEKRAHV